MIGMLRWCLAQARIVEDFHTTKIASRWPAPLKLSRFGLLVFAVLSALAVALNVNVRVSQYESWHATPGYASSDSAYLFSTTDAPYFLRLAGALKRGETIAEFESLLGYPDSKRLGEEFPAKFIDYKAPLLSQVIAYLSPTDHPSDLLRVGNQIVLICAAITSLLIIITFSATGHGLPGVVAAAGSGLSAAYLVRSSAGRIDTDMLNLGLLYITFAAVIMAGRSATSRGTLLWCFSAGILGRLFLAWYDRSILVWLALVALIIILAITRKKPFTLVGGIVLFIAISSLDFYNPLTSGYLMTTLDVSTFKLPNTLSTITEAQHLSPAALLAQATGSIELGLVCLFGLALWAIRHPVIAVVMSPLLGLALLNFIIGNRFIFYATPMLWFGLGYFLTILASYIQQSIFSTQHASWHHKLLPAGAAVLGLMMVWTNTPTNYVPRPTFTKETLAGFASLDRQFDANSTVVATWWDYGYASTFLNNLPVLHYGGAVNTATTHFVARAMLDNKQAASLGALKFLANEGSKGIGSFNNLQTLQAAFSDAVNTPSPDIVVVVTEQMAGWMSSISKIGNWDIETGTPFTPRGNNTGPQVFYEPLNCRLVGYPQRLNCAGAAFDLEQGLINGVPALSGWAHSQDGEVVRRKSFDNDGDFALQIVQNGNRINAYFLHRQLFESTFNELYYLGQIDHPSLSLHYDDYPHIRIYKLDGTPRDRPDS